MLVHAASSRHISDPWRRRHDVASSLPSPITISDRQHSTTPLSLSLFSPSRLYPKSTSKKENPNERQSCLAPLESFSVCLVPTMPDPQTFISITTEFDSCTYKNNRKKRQSSHSWTVKLKRGRNYVGIKNRIKSKRAGDWERTTFIKKKKNKRNRIADRENRERK